MKENLSEASVEPILNYFERLIPLNKEKKEPVTQKFPAVWACVVPFIK